MESEFIIKDLTVFAVAAGEKNNELDNERLFSQLRIRNLNKFPRRN